MTTVAEAVARELRRRGVERVFGYPGGESVPLMDALRAAGIAFVLARHETAAGFMAAAYGKSRGTPGVVLTTLGPGAVNLMLAVANSLLDREPLVAITAQLPDALPANYTHQRVDIAAVYRPIAKYVGQVTERDVTKTLDEAFVAAGAEPAGPAVLTLSAAVAVRAVLPGATSAPPVDAARAATEDPDEVAHAVALSLAAATRPLVIVGMGLSDSTPALRRWLGATCFPTLVTPKVKGVLDETQPPFVGVASGMAADAVVRSIIAEADCVVALGLDPAEINGEWHPRQPMTWLLESPNVYGHVPAGARIVEFATLLCCLDARRPPDRAVGAWSAVSLAARVRAPLDALVSPSVVGEVGLAEFVAALNSGLSADALVVTDVGAHKWLVGQYYRASRPGGFWMSNGLSGMGYGLPAAIGLQLAKPQASVVAIIGDGGFAMCDAELETARRLRLPLTVIVLVDGELALIRLAQDRRNVARVGTAFTTSDLAMVARGWGATVHEIDDERKLHEVLCAAQTSGDLDVVIVPIDSSQYSAVL